MSNNEPVKIIPILIIVSPVYSWKMNRPKSTPKISVRFLIGVALPTPAQSTEETYMIVPEHHKIPARRA